VNRNKNVWNDLADNSWLSREIDEFLETVQNSLNECNFFGICGFVHSILIENLFREKYEKSGQIVRGQTY
jgi:hypothetical protein